MRVLHYQPAYASQWDEFVARSPMATFLHSRRYLSYHNDRFQDVSLLIKDHKGILFGLFLAAVDSEHAGRVVSHPGITYGGLLHDGRLRGQTMLEAFEALKDHYREQGFETLRYKAVPAIYHVTPSADDLYALFRLGAWRYRCDLSCAIDLDYRPPVSNRRKRSLKKAIKHGVEVAEGADFRQPLWQLIEDNLARKFKLRPVHTVDEISKLHSLFPRNIEFVVARLNSEVVAGIVLFITARVVHAQYTASSKMGEDVCALDGVFEHCIEKAGVSGARYFDFGISNEKEGQYLNATLYEYKAEFGAGGVVHEFYELNLKS
jgi:hypothetical protein